MVCSLALFFYLCVYIIFGLNIKQRYKICTYR